MEIYLVGGAVRDSLLGLDVTERDYVVVGATEDDMYRAGFRSVGRDFPVFLHPDTNEAYALARTERKAGPGHRGFVCHAGTRVTLEEDLMRRDLTINAIAEDGKGKLLDPYGGEADLRARTLRHISDAFAEDPLRILRVARFKARFHHLGFTVDPGTRTLIGKMVQSNLLSELAPERILGELDKALTTADPAMFFRFLMEVGAHDRLWPEIRKAGVDGLAANPDIPDPDIRFACLLQQENANTVDGLCRRLHCPRQRTWLALMVAEHLDRWRSVPSLDIDSIMELLQLTDAIRRTDRFRRFNAACAAILKPSSDIPALWADIVTATAAVGSSDVTAGLTGKPLGLAIQKERGRRVNALLQHRRR